MQTTISISLGVVMAKEQVESPWESHIWRADSVFLNAPEAPGWRELGRQGTSVYYHAVTLPLELHRKDTMGYVANLEDGEPSIYVVWREDPFSSSSDPVDVALVLASPHEAEAYGQIEEEKVGAVPMPAQLVELVGAFIDAHHEEETFVKRQRQRHHREEEHNFGQEPIDVLRRRMAERARAAKASGEGGDVQ